MLMVFEVYVCIKVFRARSDHAAEVENQLTLIIFWFSLFYFPFVHKSLFTLCRGHNKIENCSVCAFY